MAVVLGYLAIKIMGKTLMGKAMILDSTVVTPNSEGLSVQVQDGCLGITLTELYPVGKVEVEGNHMTQDRTSEKLRKVKKSKCLRKQGLN